MRNIKIFLDKILKLFLIILMVILVLDVLWQVFTRFILNSPSVFTDELARYLLIWVGLFGAAYVAGQKMHLAIDLLLLKLKGKSKIYLEIFIELVIGLFSLFAMVIGGINLVSITLRLHQISAALQIPLGYVYLSIPLSGIIIIIYAIILLEFLFKSLSELNKSAGQEVT